MRGAIKGVVEHSKESHRHHMAAKSVTHPSDSAIARGIAGQIMSLDAPATSRTHSNLSIESHSRSAPVSASRHSSPSHARSSPSHARSTFAMYEQVRATMRRRKGHCNVALPATSGYAHPTCVLLRQRALSCQAVCSKRDAVVTSLHNEIEALDFEDTLKDADLDGSGDLGLYELKTVVRQHSKQYLGEEITDLEMDVLFYFVELREDRSVGDVPQAAAQLRIITLLWRIFRLYREQWKNKLSLQQGPREVLKVMRRTNDGFKVSEREARWVLDKVESLECRNEQEEWLALNLCFAYWYMCEAEEKSEGTLVRSQLTERLELEAVFTTGMVRLTNIVLLFILLMTAMLYAGSFLDQRRGIRENLEHQYQLGDLSSITTLTDVKEYINKFSQLSAALSPLSHRYFSDEAWVLQERPRSFTDSEVLPSINMDFTDAMTLQAWVELDENRPLPRTGTPIFRKALGHLGEESKLSCWSWNFPPSLAYGAHDYGGTLNPTTGLPEEFVAANYSVPVVGGVPQYPEVNGLTLHTVALNTTHVTFMINDGQVLDELPLPRPVTDCISSELLLGAKGLKLAAVRYFPKKLHPEEVVDIYRGGSTMPSIGFTAPAVEIAPVSADDHLLRNVIQQADVITQQSQETSRSSETIAVLAAQAVVNAPKTPTPLIDVNHSIDFQQTDAVLGYPFWHVYNKPTYLDKTSKNLAPGNALPAAGASGGWTVSTWLKFDTNVGHGYHIARAMPLFDSSGKPYWNGWGNFCWMLYAGASYTALYTKSGIPSSTPVDGPLLQIFDKTAPAAWQFTGKAYRHFVYQLDPTNASHPLKICIDGMCSGTAASIDKYAQSFFMDKGPPSADCAQTGLVKNYPASYQQMAVNQSKIYLNRRPEDNFPMTSWQMSTKYFNRVLNNSEIKRLFEEDPDPEDSAGTPIRETRGCARPSELKDDRTFRDSFGHDCYWYFTARHADTNVCERSPDAIKHCPVACQGRETCWGSTDDESKEEASMQIWRMQMEFRSKGKWGTTCVAKSTTPEREAIKCALNAPNWTSQCAAAGLSNCGPKDCSQHENDREALLSCLGDTTWVPQSGARFDAFLPCRDIITLNEPTCNWDDSELDKFANAANKSGSWSVNFWVEALSSEGCLEPQVRLLNGEGGTFSLLGGPKGLEPDAGHGPGCDKEDWYAHVMIGKRSDGLNILPEADMTSTLAKKGQKHFVLFGRKENGWAGVQYDMQGVDENVYSGTQGPPDILPNKDFLRVINVVGNVRITPWRLRSSYPKAGEIANMQYKQIAIQSRKRGPSEPIFKQLSRTLVRETQTFTEKTMLLAPPLLYQMRSQESQCKQRFSHDIASIVLDKGKQVQCTAPYSCPDYEISQLYKCAGDIETGEYFGMQPEVVNGRERYVEYLASMAENKIFVRHVTNQNTGFAQQQLMNTDSFIDVLTKDVTIKALFYSIEFSILSELQVNFFTEGGRVTTTYDIAHSMAVAGSGLMVFSILIGVCCFLCITWLGMNISGLRLAFRWKKYAGTSETPVTATAAVIDVVMSLLLLVLMVVLLIDREGSVSQMDAVLGKVVTANWKLPNAKGAADFGEWLEKKRIYISAFQEVSGAINQTEYLNAFTLAGAGILLMRCVCATSAHPRIALITKTLYIAVSDLVHFGLLFLIVFLGFAVIGTWRFGAMINDFRLVVTTCRAQFDAMLGPPGVLDLAGQHADNPEYFLYVLSFHFVCFFFMLNFVLAIIIDSYTKVMETVRTSDVEQDIFNDLVAICTSALLRFRHGWPSNENIVGHLKDALQTQFVTSDQLHWDGMLFKDEVAVQSFMTHYSRFPFLQARGDSEDEIPKIEDVATFQCLTLQKVEQLIRQLKRHGESNPDEGVGEDSSLNGSASHQGDVAKDPSPNGSASPAEQSAL